MRRVLGFRVDANGPIAAARAIRALDQLHDFIKGGHAETAVEIPYSAAANPPDARARASVLISDSVKSSVNQPVMVSPSMIWVRRRCRKLRVPRDIRGAADFIFMPRDEHPVARHHQIGLDVVRALFDRQAIRLEGVLGPFAARAAMCNDNNSSTLSTLCPGCAQV